MRALRWLCHKVRFGRKFRETCWYHWSHHEITGATAVWSISLNSISVEHFKDLSYNPSLVSDIVTDSIPLLKTRQHLSRLPTLEEVELLRIRLTPEKHLGWTTYLLKCYKQGAKTYYMQCMTSPIQVGVVYQWHKIGLMVFLSHCIRAREKNPSVIIIMESPFWNLSEKC